LRGCQIYIQCTVMHAHRIYVHAGGRLGSRYTQIRWGWGVPRSQYSKGIQQGMDGARRGMVPCAGVPLSVPGALVAMWVPVVLTVGHTWSLDQTWTWRYGDLTKQIPMLSSCQVAAHDPLHILQHSVASASRETHGYRNRRRGRGRGSGWGEEHRGRSRAVASAAARAFPLNVLKQALSGESDIVC